MKITADANVLVRALVGDDARQSAIAQATLESADVVAIALSALCELAWVLARGYGFEANDIAEAIKGLVDSAEVAVDRPAVGAGLALLRSGGDFADGVIAFEGKRLGGDVFVSFDRKATKLVQGQGGSVQLL